MKMVIIEAVKEPDTFDGKKYTKAQWTEATKAGPKKVPYSTAIEAVKNSGGLYAIKATDADLPKKLVDLADPEDMSAQALFAEMTAHGKPPKKQMARKVAVEFVKRLREEGAQLIVDDDD